MLTDTITTIIATGGGGGSSLPARVSTIGGVIYFTAFVGHSTRAAVLFVKGKRDAAATEFGKGTDTDLTN